MKKKSESDRMVLNQKDLKKALAERKGQKKDTCKCPECGHVFSKGEKKEEETESYIAEKE